MDRPGTLRASFIYADNVTGHALSKFCPTPAAAPAGLGAGGTVVTPSGLAIDVAAKFVEVGVSSLIDAASMRMRSKSTTLDTVIPIDGFFRADGSTAIDNASLVLHNGIDDSAKEASLIFSLSVVVSSDRSAFKFRVFTWKVDRFLRPSTSQWLQKKNERDWIIRIEFLTPGAAGLGLRSAFIEQAFQAITLDDLKLAFFQGKELPWVNMPNVPPVLVGSQPKGGLFVPANIHVTIIETTEPNLFASWIVDTLTATKSSMATGVSGELRDYLLSIKNSGDLSSLGYSNTAFTAYKTSWEKLRDLKGAEPVAPAVGSPQTVVDQFNVSHASWAANFAIQSGEVEVNLKLAINSFQKAGITWPGNFPV